MSRGAAWFVHGSVAVSGLTGLVYGWMRYFAEPTDEFALVNHPWEPTWKDLHVLGVPLLVFGCALLWRTHVWGRIRAGFEPRRRTGVLLAVLLLPMIASGYVLQTRFGESWRTGWIWIHGLCASLWLATYGVHQLSARE